MHFIVEMIPLLLHTSLLFFFAGLIAFLIPVNAVIMSVTAALLVIMAGVYALLTLLPLLYPDCPYRTPLSGTCWHVMETVTSIWYQCHITPDLAAGRSVVVEAKTPIEFMLEKANEYSEEQTKRDGQALIWTVKSLADNSELEPLIEAIPDVLWVAHRRRYVYDDNIRRLMEDPDVQLFRRIQSFLDSCHSGLLPPEVSKRRQISCFKTLWALASLSHSGASSFPLFPYRGTSRL
jgi:hypothetical protein